MRDGGSTGQRQAGHDGQDGGEGHGSQETEQHVAADGLGQVHGNHVAAADQLAADRTTFEELRFWPTIRMPHRPIRKITLKK